MPIMERNEKMTLDEFIEQNEKKPSKLTSSNAYVTVEGFEFCYVRYGMRLINGKKYDRVLDIARIEVKKPGTGTFTKFINYIVEQNPGICIYLENAILQNEGFIKKLLNLGFDTVKGTNDGFSCSYFKQT